MTALAAMFGSLRSGTTMLRLMLNGHPRLVCPGETDFLTDYLVSAPGGGWRYDLDALSEDRIFRASRARLPETEEAGPAFRRMVADLRGSDDGTLVLVAHRGLGRLLDLAGSLPVLHLIRDPRDVARSAIGMGWAGNTFYGADIWLKTEREWDSHAPRLPSSQALEIRYEGLVRAPEPTLHRICSFLGERHDPAMLEYGAQSTYDPPDPALAEQWRQKQSPGEIALTEIRVGDRLVRRGYQPSGHPRVHPAPHARLALWADNKGRIWAHRIRRHGWCDPLLVTLGRRLRLPNLSRPAQERMRARTIRSLK